jgi:uncharacterized protein YjiS (DUF1127 family)
LLTSFVLSKVRAWFIFRKTVRELECHNDKDLSDLGISRSDIKSISWEATQIAHSSGI